MEPNRDQHLHVRVTAEERGQMEAAARAEGLPLSQWVRQTLLRSARKLAQVQRGR